MLLDEEDRLQATTQIHTSQSLEAAAGTGKTNTLVKRVLQLLASGVSISNLVIITFQKTASLELRQRIQQSLVQNDAPWAKKALASLPDANIGTIHSFAQTIIQTYPLEAGIDPGFSVISGIPRDLLFEDTFRKWYRERFRALPTPILNAQRYGLMRSIDQIQKLAHEMQNTNLPENAPPLSDILTAPFMQQFLSVLSVIVELSESTCYDPTDKAKPSLRKLQTTWENLSSIPSEHLLAMICRLDLPNVGGAKKNWSNPDLLTQVKEQVKILKELQTEIKAQVGASLWSDLFIFASTFADAWQTAKKTRSLLEFDDLLSLSSTLIQTNQAVQEQLKQKYRYFLVDEFQDTDPVQWSMLRALSHKRDGSLFVVGDPKQAIFGFRGADVATYLQATKELPNLKIHVNFRSVPNILQIANTLCEPLFTEPQYVALSPYRPSHTAADEVILLESTAADLNAKEAAQQEAETVAQWVLQSMATARMVFDKNLNNLRPMCFSDVVCLFRSRSTTYNAYLKAFQKYGIPYQTGLDHQIRQRSPALRHFLHLLEAINEPQTPLSVARALRSLYFAISDEDVYQFQQMGGQLRLDSRLPSGTPPHLQEAFELLHHLYLEKLTPSQLILRLIEEIKAVQTAYTWESDAGPNGLYALLDASFSVMEAEPNLSLTSFLKWVHHSGSRTDNPLAEAAGKTGATAGVTFLTMHAAKGLEFPCAIVSTSGGEKRSTPTLLHHPSGLQARQRAKGWSSPEYAQTRGYEVAKQEVKEHAASEAKRLLYVALTRARDYLILPDFPSRHSSNLLQSYILGTATRYKERLGLPAWQRPNQDLYHKVHPTMAPKDLSRDALPQVLLVSPSLHNTLPMPQRPTNTASGKFQGRQLGRVVHEALAALILEQDTTLAIQKACAHQGIPEAQEEVAELLDHMKNHPLFHEILAAPRKAIETPFQVRIADQIVHGRIDLLYESNDKTHLLDFKTDVVSLGAEKKVATERGYLQQLTLYRQALANLGITVDKSLLFFIRTGGLVELC